MNPLLLYRASIYYFSGFFCHLFKKFLMYFFFFRILKICVSLFRCPLHNQNMIVHLLFLYLPLKFATENVLIAFLFWLSFISPSASSSSFLLSWYYMQFFLSFLLNDDDDDDSHIVNIVIIKQKPTSYALNLQAISGVVSRCKYYRSTKGHLYCLMLFMKVTD